jgi:hypothetical protein
MGRYTCCAVAMKSAATAEAPLRRDTMLTSSWHPRR